MTTKQKDVIYYYLGGYNALCCALICGTKQRYVHRILTTDWGELDAVMENYEPSFETIGRRMTLDLIMKGIGIVHIPRSQKFEYISLLAYLKVPLETVLGLFPLERNGFVTHAYYYGGRYWTRLDPEFLGITLREYRALMQLDLKDNIVSAEERKAERLVKAEKRRAKQLRTQDDDD